MTGDYSKQQAFLKSLAELMKSENFGLITQSPQRLTDFTLSSCNNIFFSASYAEVGDKESISPADFRTFRCLETLKYLLDYHLTKRKVFLSIDREHVYQNDGTLRKPKYVFCVKYVLHYLGLQSQDFLFRFSSKENYERLKELEVRW